MAARRSASRLGIPREPRKTRHVADDNLIRRLVVVGASAGGLEALSALLASLDARTEVAVVVALHLSADHPSMMGEILGRRTPLTVVTVEGTRALEAGHLYLVGPGATLEVTHAEVTTSTRETSGPPHVVDALFESAAQTWGERAVGVVLSGSGSDGARGAGVLRAAGARVLCQSPSEAKFGSMSLSVIRAGFASQVGTCDEISRWIEAVARGEDTEDDLPAAFWEILELARERLGVDLYKYRTATLSRRMLQRARTRGFEDLEAYAVQVAQDDHELHHLSRYLLVGTTEFFRDAPVFDLIRREVLPPLIERDAIRVWCAGCSTGEEVYSVAAMVSDFIERSESKALLKVFATDARTDALEVASKGRYTSDEIAGLPPEFRERYFNRVNDAWQVGDELRSTVVFTTHDALLDPPFTRIDLLLFRNVLIYLRPETHARVLSRLHFALQKQGVLVVGSGESAETYGDGFAPLRPGVSSVFRKVGESRPDAFSGQRSRVRPARPIGRREDVLSVLGLRRALQEFGRPALLLSALGDVVHVLHDPAPYFRLSGGPVSVRADQLAVDGLAGVITASLARVQRTGESVRLASGPLRELPGVIVSVSPLGDVDGHLLLLLLETAARREPHDDATVLADLHDELADARRSLDDSLSDLQVANEELEAANEEMLASNEELEATNEELQATNEELYSVNAEREARLGELTALRDDIEAMLDKAGIAAVFVDAEQRLVRSIGPVPVFFPISKADLGRPLRDLGPFVEGLDLSEEIELVHRQGRTAERSVVLHNGRSVGLFISPRPSETHEGELVVGETMLMLVDETETARSRRDLERILDRLPAAIAVVEADGGLAQTNASWRSLGSEERGSLGQTLSAIAPSDDARISLLTAVRSVLDGTAGAIQQRHRGADAVWRRTRVEGLSAGRAVVVSSDETQRRDELEAATSRAAEFEHALRCVGPGVLIADAQMQVCWVNKAAVEALGRVHDDLLVGRDVRLLVTSGSRLAVERAQTMGAAPPAAVELLHAGGHRVSATLSVGEGGGLVFALATERRSTQPSEALSTLAGGVAHELNNALAPLATLVEAWVDDERLPSDVRAELGQARIAFAHGRSVTRDLLRFAHHGKPSDAETAVDEAVSQVVRLLRAGGTRAHLTVHAETGAFVSAPAAQLSHAVLNLVLNALEATSDTGHVHVEVQLEEAHASPVRVVVRDDGIGMDEAVQARIFEPFYSTKGHVGGTGLGLSLVQSFARSAGGAIECRSTPGEGTEFVLSLPRVDPPVVAPEETVDGLRLDGLRVLVVDDDPMVRRALGTLLEGMGAAVTIAPGGSEALEVFDGHGVVIMDVMMPGMSGYEAQARLRKLSDVPILMLTGDPSSIPGGEPEKGIAWLLKPASRSELLRCMRSLGVLG